MEELNLGKKLQAIRTSKKISVRKLAAMTNLTASMISQIENGAVNPSIPTLRTISSALETPIYYFFKDEDNASVVVTQSTRMVLGNKQEPSVVYELLTPDTRGEIEFCMMVIPPKAYSCREPKGHFGEEVVDEIKTKKFVEVMNNLKVEKALVVLNDNDVNVIKSASNLATVKTAQTNEINVYDILKYDTVVVTKDAVKTIEEVYA